MNVHIVLNGIPPSLNTVAGRKNVWEYREQKKYWTQLVWATCHNYKKRLEKPFEKAVVYIDYYFPDRRRRDADNYCGKFLLDGLTKAGIIVDDDLKHITVVIRGFYDKESPRTEITVEREKE